ncbi:MAG TPA: DNA mismatch repair endonuclease MutL [Candidatus Caccopulliclostridium gallistercoris]|uniref:DNA mismatch repair protein MutL n=1 Tax=Candidatus Caccopulliclostridium gallistercoris TaxID=2840719 RepID=A0A9D1SYM5_9FIRM|nr:DNA mismatch repair endonuclease MutL [Candidatus Caccopulliclostridium gallistercoris]
MSKINILDKIVSNRISAGEVVEKPASVVKELIENSIDAGADKIVIEIEEGGIKSISILDNGSGIEKDDIKLAFMPHATSKIKNVEDLDNIGTLGFRGEALASIASVAQVEMISKTKASELGSSIKIDGGEFGEIGEVAMNTGTQIVVKNLFYNTPARRKFLRKPKTEEGEITDLVEKIILANPTLQIRYVIDGKIKYNTTGSGLYANIYTIYGRETVENIIEINFEREGYKLTGYIGKPEISKANRTYQTLIVNGRVVRSAFISNAIQEVYQNFLMKNKFPFFVLNLILPLDSVDVNVHPSKMEVKFENLGFIRTLFTNAVYYALVNANYTRSVVEEEKNEEEKAPSTTNSFVEKREPLNNLPNISEDEGISYLASKENMFGQDEKLKEVSLNYEESMLHEIESNSEESRLTDYILNTNHKNPYVVKEFQEIIEDAMPKAKIIGVIFKTYILVEKENNLYMIDQHAAHERALYDKFSASVENENVLKQGLITPYYLKLNSLEYDFFKRNFDVLSSVGFDAVDKGDNQIEITAIPYVLPIEKLGEYIDYFISNLQDYSSKASDYFKFGLMQHACKMAVKSGQVLSLNEIETLIDEMEKHVLLCPHGRPILIKITKSQIEKWFKRIV